MTSVASLPEQSPGCRCRSLTGAGARTSAAGPLARLLPRRRFPPPHLPARPPPGGWSRNQSLQRRAGPGRCWDWGRGVTRICPLCPGAPEYINSAVSSQTLSHYCTPPQYPPSDPRPLSLRVGFALPGGRLGCGEAGSANRHWFSFLFPFIDFGWSPRAAAPGVAMNGWMPARWDHQVRRDVAGARGAPPAWGQAPSPRRSWGGPQTTLKRPKACSPLSPQHTPGLFSVPEKLGRKT
ncbi:LOW QUALITY PROTEIN: putative uncharacterized protein FLJ36797 [Macaca thibetana thibetana]|uniref:LOW QUALITY PROTEIN: putative uncharacterized protein FLJ36797 n=1 Tax=Macaca thibetana thibetana TaxID=257877 RepID=UPI0021BC7BFB|nr:LOW QUALITY PROTEIN: putative uncharacterized protein FLJ36797 [Macaca thibetana thibetana]